jgi:hypothetical protein
VTAILAAMLIPAAVGAFRLAFASGPEPFLVRPSSGECIREAAWMRFHHMDLLFDAQDAAVRRDSRQDVTLSACAGCHEDRAVFCDRCHVAAGVAPDCFDCHAFSSSKHDVPDAIDGGGP